MHEITPGGGGDHFLPKNVKEREKKEKYPQVIWDCLQLPATGGYYTESAHANHKRECDKYQALAWIKGCHVGGLQEREDY